MLSALNQESEECCGPANDTAHHNERALFSFRRYAFLLPLKPSPFFPPPLAWAAATPVAAAAFTNGVNLLFFTSRRHYCEVQGTDPSVSAPKNAHEKKQANEPTRVSRLLPFHLLVPSLRAPPSTHNAHTTQLLTLAVSIGWAMYQQRTVLTGRNSGSSASGGVKQQSRRPTHAFRALPTRTTYPTNGRLLPSSTSAQVTTQNSRGLCRRVDGFRGRVRERMLVHYGQSARRTRGDSTTRATGSTPSSPSSTREPSNLKIAVVGAGPCGLTTALALRHFGMSNVTVFDTHPMVRPALGAAFNLNGGAAVLDKLGLLHVFRRLNNPMKKVRSRRVSGACTQLMEIDIPSMIRGDAAAVASLVADADGGELCGTVMRADLLCALADELPASALSLGREVAGVAAVPTILGSGGGDGGGGGAQLQFTDGGISETFDLVIGADGIRSKVGTSRSPIQP